MGSISDKKILITGASGYIGSALLKRLEDDSSSLFAISRKEYRSTKTVNWIQLDLSDTDKVHRLIKKIRPDIIFHSGGNPDAYKNFDLIFPTFINNTTATLNLLTAAKQFGCKKFVHFGTMDEPDIFHKEFIPSSPYAASKMASSSYCRLFMNSFNLPVVLLKIFFVYGPGPQNLIKLIPYSISSMLNGKRPHIQTGGRKFDFIYIEDAVDIIIRSAINDIPVNVDIDVGSGKATKICDIIDMISEIIDNRTKPDYGTKSGPLNEFIKTADIDNTFRYLNYKPSTDLRIGLKKTVEYYKGLE